MSSWRLAGANGTLMNIFEALDYEHQLIANALQLARSCALRMALPDAAAEPAGQELAGFCLDFISQCHQAKEFNLFVRLLQKGHSHVIAPITGLHADHNRFNQLTEALEAAWRCARDEQPGAYALVAGYLADYAALMQEHMQKEERFYLVIQSVLTPADQEELTATFERINSETLGAGGHERYCQWADQLTLTST